MRDKLTFRDDEATLADWLTTREPGLVAFDGLQGAGKTWLSKDAGARLGCPVIDADCFLSKHRGAFLSELNITELATTVQKALADAPRVLLSSVCARQVVDRMDIKAKSYVYVLLLTREGEPDEKYALEAEDHFDLQELKSEGLEGLDLEVREYHWLCKPRRDADAIFERTAFWYPEVR
jgi:hypothetical protein